MSLCSRIDEYTYDPISESPAAYVRDLRTRHMSRLIEQMEKDEKDTEEMTLEELRAYYDAGGANRLQGMDASAKQDLFKQFLVRAISTLIVFTKSCCACFRRKSRKSAR